MIMYSTPTDMSDRTHSEQAFGRTHFEWATALCAGPVPDAADLLSKLLDSVRRCLTDIAQKDNDPSR